MSKLPTQKIEPGGEARGALPKPAGQPRASGADPEDSSCDKAIEPIARKPWTRMVVVPQPIRQQPAEILD